MLKKLATVSGVVVALSFTAPASAMGPLIMAAPAIGHMLGIGAVGMAAGAGAMAAGGMAAGAGMTAAAGSHMAAAGTAGAMAHGAMAAGAAAPMASSDFAGWPLAQTAASAPDGGIANTAMWTATGASTGTKVRTR